jgi:LacI family transcriptional regulator
MRAVDLSFAFQGIHMGLSKSRTRSVTIADVAREAGVAQMTVSRAMNGHPHVKPETLTKVREAIAKLSYSPNQAARMLMGQRSNSIALVIPELRNPFFAVVANGVQTAARSNGSLVWMVASNNDVRIERQEIEKLLSYNVDGILLIPSDPGHRYLKDLLRTDVPVVAIDLPIESGTADSVVIENRQSSQEAVEHLIGHGCEQILCVGGWPGLFTIRERIAGYESAMRQAGLQSKVLTDPYDLAATRRAVEQLLRRKKTRAAIFCLNQLVTEIVLTLLEEMRVAIPEQVGIIGFDDFSLASLFKPRLTVVRQPTEELGACAARILFERLGSKELLPRRRTVLPTELVVRESCGCLRTAGRPGTRDSGSGLT